MSLTAERAARADAATQCLASGRSRRFHGVPTASLIPLIIHHYRAAAFGGGVIAAQLGRQDNDQALRPVNKLLTNY